MTILELSSRERVLLELIMAQTGDARELRRAQALMWLDEGDSVAEVAAHLGVTQRTIYYWVEQFEASNERDLHERLAAAPRSGRPPTAHGIIDGLIEEVIETDPCELGYRATVWTAPLLRQYLVEHHQLEVGQRSVSYALARLDLVWKRPRYDLSRCPSTWRQAKGDSNAGSPRASARSF